MNFKVISPKKVSHKTTRELVGIVMQKKTCWNSYAKSFREVPGPMLTTY